MVSLNFKKQFADDVRSGRKKQTIRAMRKRRFKVGDKLHLYIGLRTKRCEKLVDSDPICLECSTINILSAFGPIHLKPSGSEDWQYLSNAESEALAQADGFRSLVDLLIFFNDHHQFPFVGQLIKW